MTRLCRREGVRTGALRCDVMGVAREGSERLEKRMESLSRGKVEHELIRRAV